MADTFRIKAPMGARLCAGEQSAQIAQKKTARIDDTCNSRRSCRRPMRRRICVRGDCARGTMASVLYEHQRTKRITAVEACG